MRLRGGSRRALPFSAALLAVAFALCMGVSASATSSRAEPGPPNATCFWLGPIGTSPYYNRYYPDEGVYYWPASITVPAGASVALHGKFAHARYEALTAYNGTSGHLDSIHDTEIEPDRGSTNPYIAGHLRDLPRRSFTLHLVASSVPAHAARNTLYLGQIATTASVIVVLRIYQPDHGLGPTGGESLPSPTLTTASGEHLTGSAMCAALKANVGNRVIANPLSASEYKALRDQPDELKGFPADDPPRIWANYSESDDICRTFTPTKCSKHPVRMGGIFGDPDNGYLRTWISRQIEPVVVFRGKMPTTPRTVGGEKRMQAAQLRYWSICQYQAWPSWRTASCRFDEQIPLTKSRRYTIVISSPSQRPKNATAACGVAWMPFSRDGDGEGDKNLAFVTFRNQLPSPSFHHSILSTRVPGDEARVMGPYFPRGRYYTVRQFERLGCRR